MAGHLGPGPDDTVGVWEPAGQKTPVSTWPGHEGTVLAVAAHPSESVVASGGADGVGSKPALC